VIARQLCDNAGFDATNILNKLRQKHAQDGGVWYGVDILNEDIADNFLACVWEPAIVKSNAIVAASEATCLLLRWSFFWILGNRAVTVSRSGSLRRTRLSCSGVVIPARQAT
jgi:chaperonin GroEL (HSP60 family)